MEIHIIIYYLKKLKHNLGVESQEQCGKTAQFSDTENVTEANSVLAVDEEPCTQQVAYLHLCITYVYLCMNN